MSIHKNSEHNSDHGGMRKIVPKTHEGLSATSPSGKEKPHFPTFRIELIHLPEAKKWDVGSEYMVTLKLKQTDISISRFQNDAEFDIIGINPKGGGSDHKED